MKHEIVKDGANNLNRRQFLKVSAALGGAMLISNPSALLLRPSRGSPSPREAWEGSTLSWEAASQPAQ